ncbi:MAG TPA: hypothetical protein VD713_00865 [Sphingomonadales bacterium]|nr:hypothetical protein [Sphingomonadales bacterium]
MLKTIIARLKEPSTYAGMAGIAAAIGLGAEEWQTISMALAGIFGVLAMVLREKSSAK